MWSWCPGLAVLASGTGKRLIVAHSLGCWAVSEWVLRDRPARVRAFMVAVPDPASAPFPRAEAPTFAVLEPHPLSCATLVIASDDDPYCEVDESRRIAQKWGAAHHSVGAHGHLNSQSGLGDWVDGRSVLAAFIEER